jgi:hypothetical protein
MPINQQQYVDAIRELARVMYATIAEFPDGAPAGPMYAACMQFGATLETFTALMDAMERAGLVRRNGNLYFAIVDRPA